MTGLRVESDSQVARTFCFAISSTAAICSHRATVASDSGAMPSRRTVRVKLGLDYGWRSLQRID